jgi:hypothetical protein
MQLKKLKLLLALAMALMGQLVLKLRVLSQLLKPSKPGKELDLLQ